VLGGLLLLSRHILGRFMRWVDKITERFDLPYRRLMLYGRVLRSGLSALFAGLLVYTVSLIWQAPTLALFHADWFLAGLKTLVNLFFVLALAALLWEAISAILNRTFRGQGDNAARMQTVLPIVRNVAFMVFAALFGLVALSELGVNITPFLAGAGIVGVAVGFGAQTMVKDFLTGFTLILEDILRVGDVVTVAGHTGTVEVMTLRKLQLRDVAGVVSTIPFSQITTIENATKEYSYYLLDMGVHYRTDIEAAFAVMRQVDASMRADPAFARDILDDIDILGVDRFADSAIILRARLKTRPLRQWVVGREFNKRLKQAFDTAGIIIPYPHQVQVKDIE
jgi:moderate conductance mechanosensitive channel